ncbi:hypothetical protein AGMMS49936_02270 [Endomicrobiia bacterium]|nr:hypothetical protein AGMMS49936_02270 [Endomicrobiia bacterium]
MKRLLFVLGKHGKVDKGLWHRYTDSQLRGMDLPAHQVDQGKFLYDTNLKTLMEDLGVPAEYCGIYNTDGEKVAEALSLNEIVARRTKVRKQAEHDLDEFNEKGAVLLETKEGLEEAVKTAKEDEEWAKKRKEEHEAKINEILRTRLRTSSTEAHVDNSILNQWQTERDILKDGIRQCMDALAENNHLEDKLKTLEIMRKFELGLEAIEDKIEANNKTLAGNECANLNPVYAPPDAAEREAADEIIKKRKSALQLRQVCYVDIVERGNSIAKSMKEEADRLAAEQAAKAQADREKAEEKEIEIVDEKGEEEQGKEKEKGEGEGTGTEAGTGTEKGKEKEIEIVDEKGEEEQGKEKEKGEGEGTGTEAGTGTEKGKEKEIEIVDEKGEEEQGGGKEEEQGSGGQAQA